MKIHEQKCIGLWKSFDLYFWYYTIRDGRVTRLVTRATGYKLRYTLTWKFIVGYFYNWQSRILGKTVVVSNLLHILQIDQLLLFVFQANNNQKKIQDFETFEIFSFIVMVVLKGFKLFNSRLWKLWHLTW